MYGIRACIYDWLIKKEKGMSKRNQGRKRISTREFADGFHNSHVDWIFSDTGSHCRTALFRKEDEHGRMIDDAWGMQYRHFDTQPEAMRSWYTDVTLRRITENVCLMNVAVSYRKSRYTLVADTSVTTPNPSIPRFMKNLIGGNQYEVAFDSEFLSFANGSLVDVKSVEAMDAIYRNFINSCLRKHVVILSYGDRIIPLAKQLAVGLMGKVTVLHIGSQDASRLFMEKQEIGLRVCYNGIRIFYPRKSYDDDIRSTCYNQDVLKTIIGEVVSNLLSAFELRNPAAYKTITDIHHLISVAHFKQQLEKKKCKVEEHELAAMSLEEQLSKKQKDYDDLWTAYVNVDAEHQEQINAYRKDTEVLEGEVKRYQKYIAEQNREKDEINLKLTEAFMAGDNDTTAAKKKIDRLIKEIDRCIALMEG